MFEFISKHRSLFIFGILGIVAYFAIEPSLLFIYQTTHTLSRPEIRKQADDFLKSHGYQIDDYYKRLSSRTNDNVISYLQSTFGVIRTSELLKNELKHLTFWDCRYYLNVPRDEPQDRYRVWLTHNGEIIHFDHNFPDSVGTAHLSLEKAQALCETYITNNTKINLADFTLDDSTSNKQKNRTDFFFKWVEKNPKYKEAKYAIQFNIKGDEISQYQYTLELPKELQNKYGISLTTYSVLYTLGWIFSYIVLLFIVVIFLKKYHEGEIGIRHGLIFFLTILVVGLINTINAASSMAEGTTIGNMSRLHVTLLIGLFNIFFIEFFNALSVFTAWSVGESNSRPGWEYKLSAIDGVLRGKIFTVNAASSIVRGYLAGMTLVGFISLYLYTTVHLFGAKPSYMFILPSIDKEFIFLTPIVTGLLLAISDGVIYRLFFITYLKKVLRSEWLAVIIAAILALSRIPDIGLFPMGYQYFAKFAIGLFLGYLFVKYDILTVLLTSFTAVLFSQAIPLLYMNNNWFAMNGLIVLGVLAVPLVIAVIGFKRKTVFEYQGDELPPHIQRISERERMAKELEIAKKVQMSLLPKDSPHFPGLDCSAICIPAREVGGDYYDFVRLSNNKLGVAIGDVSGKGVPSAIYMTLSKGILQSYAEDNSSPKQVLCKVNKLIYQMLEKNSFVSMIYAIINMTNFEVTFARAGHNPAILYMSENNATQQIEPGGIGIGLEQGLVFEKTLAEENMTLNKGDLLVFFTDGFTEAMNGKLDEYGEDRLTRVIEQNNEASAQAIVEAILKDVHRFIKGYPQHDDMTIIVIKRNR
ncbi:PP2C family protein-serine/threonine phosphatase [candidate division KSB1 bacterium]|nr:PP2C family protein-serine/threonine phosphatase [candidate division KSB1 bacterium]